MSDLWNNIDLDIIVTGINSLHDWIDFLYLNSHIFTNNGIRIIVAIPEQVSWSDLKESVVQFPFFES